MFVLGMLFIRRFSLQTNPSKYVEKVRLLEYWRAQDEILRKEFVRSKILLILDKSPLLVKGTSGLTLSRHNLPELQKSLGDYGVFFDVHHSCLLDAEEENNLFVPLFGVSVKTETPPEGSPVDKKQLVRALGDSLGGRFTDIRSAMFMVSSEADRLLLARFYSLSKWAHVFCRCPRCAASLQTKISKASARCRSCNTVYYPNIAPAVITLIKNRENSHLLLVRQRNYTPGMYTCVAGFANIGEHLHETVRREVAEEVGLEIDHVVTEDYSQPWPLPDGSLMIPNVSIADMNQPMDKCPAELENARWFSRDEVQAAYDRTLSDPLYKNVPEDVIQRQELLYIPPSGVLAHRLIRKFLKEEV